MKKVIECVDEKKLVRLARELFRIRSFHHEEARIAEFCASYMNGVGIDVELQDVPVGEGVKTKQVIGRLRGTGGGVSLMLCSHLDHGLYRPELWTKDPFGGIVEHGRIYGAGAQKAGVAAMIAAADALKKAGIELRGDVIVACVAGEQSGGIGVEYMLNKGTRADTAVVAENTNLDIVTVSVSGNRARILVKGDPLMFMGGSAGGTIKKINPIEKMFQVIHALGPSWAPLKPDDWLTFEAHPDLPGFPQILIRAIESQGQGVCAITVDCRIVPGQNEETFKADLENLLSKLKAKDPELDIEIEMPPPKFHNRPAFEISRDERIVQTVAKWHEYVTGKKPIIGSGCRLGVGSDAISLMAAGVKALNYGPADVSYRPDLMIDQGHKIEDIVNAAKVYALTAVDLCI
jgi:acetylornithine deacetylase